MSIWGRAEHDVSPPDNAPIIIQPHDLPIPTKDYVSAINRILGDF